MKPFSLKIEISKVLPLNQDTIITKTFQNMKIRLIIINSKEWFIAKDIAELLGYKRTADAITQHCKNSVSFNDFLKGGTILNLQDILGNSWKQTKLICESDILLLIQKSRIFTYKSKAELMEFFKIEKNVIFHSPLEIEFFHILKDTLKTFQLNLDLQKRVLNYKIDAYIPETNLMIEYDESHHKTKKNIINDKVRENLIIKEIKCDVIRLSDSNSHGHNIGLVINKLFSIKKIEKNVNKKSIRQEKLITLLKKKEISTKNLSAILKVSKTTILRDLKEIRKSYTIHKIKLGRNISYVIHN